MSNADPHAIVEAFTKSGRVYRAATGLAEDREGADTSCSYPGIDISRKRFTAPFTSAMFHSMYRAST
jgi:hypothetical protein